MSVCKPSPHHKRTTRVCSNPKCSRRVGTEEPGAAAVALEARADDEALPRARDVGAAGVALEARADDEALARAREAGAAAVALEASADEAVAGAQDAVADDDLATDAIVALLLPMVGDAPIVCLLAGGEQAAAVELAAGAHDAIVARAALMEARAKAATGPSLRRITANFAACATREKLFSAGVMFLRRWPLRRSVGMHPYLIHDGHPRPRGPSVVYNLSPNTSKVLLLRIKHHWEMAGCTEKLSYAGKASLLLLA